jgi:hypothetical protein
MNKTTIKRSVLTLMAGMALSVAGSARAATIQDFEGSLGANESLLGDAGITTGGYFGINDTNGGNGQLLLTTINNSPGNADFGGYSNQSGSNAADTGFTTFFGFTPIDAGTTGKEGSGYRIINLSLTAGQTLSFDYDFLTQEGSNKDFAFYTLALQPNSPSGTPVITDAFSATLNTTSGVGNPFGSETGYTTFTTPTITTTGTYTLTIGVMDAGNPSTDDSPSGLLVDNIQTNAAVPEPSTVGLLIAGAAGFAAVRRRIRK